MSSRQKWIGSALIGVLVLALGVAFVLNRSTSDDQQSTTAASESNPMPRITPTPTLDPKIRWAGDVCAATANLRDVSKSAALLALGDLDLSGDIGQQATDQLGVVMSELEQPLTDLGVALGSVPVDYYEAPETLLRAQQLTEQATEQVKRTIDAITAVREAGTFVEQAILAAAALAAGQSAIDTGRQLIDALTQLDSDGAYRDAFSQAPQCAAP
jgi:hypothetical protein